MPEILEAFANSLEELRNTPLHSQLYQYFCAKLQFEQSRPLTLLDVYYDESKLLVWRD